MYCLPLWYLFLIILSLILTCWYLTLILFVMLVILQIIVPIYYLLLNNLPVVLFGYKPCIYLFWCLIKRIISILFFAKQAPKWFNETFLSKHLCWSIFSVKYLFTQVSFYSGIFLLRYLFIQVSFYSGIFLFRYLHWLIWICIHFQSVFLINLTLSLKERISNWNMLSVYFPLSYLPTCVYTIFVYIKKNFYLPTLL